ncbi:MAG: type I restriction-modification system endonuclease [Deltaproteobacteria bacterium]|nr:type I restriction-modification system endonuclease [Deltaproteobacteria bacterium]
MTAATPAALSSFAFLQSHGPLYFQLCAVAEQTLGLDPTLTLVKLRALGEAFARDLAHRAGLIADKRDSSAAQVDLLRMLEQRGLVPDQIADVFHLLRRSGNRAVHDFTGTRQEALDCLKLAHRLACWFHRTAGGVDAKLAKLPPWTPPVDPTARLRELETEVAKARADADAHKASAASQAALAAATQARNDEEAAARAVVEADRDVWQSLAQQSDADLQKAEAEQLKLLEQLQTKAKEQPTQALNYVKAQSIAAAGSTPLDEAETRLIIDDQLRAAGWEVDTRSTRHSLGARPEKGRNLAIAEWPTARGPADYLLFCGLVAVAVVEAKKNTTDVVSAIDQAKRYATHLAITSPMQRAAPSSSDPATFPGWEASTSEPGQRFAVPFLYASNGRAFQHQHETKSGVWFLDGRKKTNHPRPLTGWHSPETLLHMLAVDVDAADAALAADGADHVEQSLNLRPYQVKAIRSVEQAIARGQRSLLVAMATGTGKTRMVVGLIHRLLKAQRVRRVLFLVDRSALGIQAQGAFHEFQLDTTQMFSQTWEVLGLESPTPETSTKVHIATVQGMVQRILYGDAKEPVPVDRYDLVIVDESHRGYTLDQEMTEGELELRDLADYVSTYRRVLDHFDAVKVGLTATPAQHTVEIFGKAVFTYRYREAVVDGFLIDHEPPWCLVTDGSDEGIHWKKGDEVGTVTETGAVQLSLLPDEKLDFEVEDFNRRVITDGFNRAIAKELAGLEHFDPEAPGKTIVFCVDDDHAERFVPIFKAALVEAGWNVDDAAVRKITGKTDKPLDAIRHFKNEPMPKIAVTVDLLTTGIDIPKVVNLVFLRRVKSRILYEQMIGRATRRCDEIGKDVFRIWDCVGLYDALAPVTDMKPLVRDVTRTTEQLLEELVDPRAVTAPGSTASRTQRDEVFDEVNERLRRVVRRLEKKRADHALTAEGLQAVDAAEAALGCPLSSLPDVLHGKGARDVVALLLQRPEIGVLFGRLGAHASTKVEKYVGPPTDVIKSVTQGYGPKNQQPGDYLDEFAAFLLANVNLIPALQVVTTRPRDLTRAQLRDLALKLDAAGFSEVHVQSAWKAWKNVAVAARLIGFIRQRALGSPLVPYDQRVDRAVKKILQRPGWNKPQEKLIERVATAMKNDVVVDEDAFRVGAWQSSGGFKGIDKRLGGRLRQVLDDLSDEAWRDDNIGLRA